MSDALALPSRPNLEQYKKIARDFQKACKAGDAAVREWAARLAPAEGDAERILRHWHRLQESNQHVKGCTLAGAQLLVARCHSFESWPKFSRHLAALTRGQSPESQFEQAADAIAAGDIGTLGRLLRENPELVRRRSAREHRSTLLHYVSANGIEDFRQKTPDNIVDIATLLLDRGADVNAESEAYGGGSTALNLTATSYHPEAAGVQLALLDLLIGRGAIIDNNSASVVNSCLHNGRGEAAEYLAARGARLDLEGAAGVGRLDIVERLIGEAPPQQLRDGFTWACEFGRTRVVDFLLNHGMTADAILRRGETGLHWAALAGHADTAQVLLDRGAPVNAVDATHGGTPLGWALHGWGTGRPRERDRRSYHETVARLVRAGANVDPRWFEGADDRMAAALRGEVLPGTAAPRALDGAAAIIRLPMKTPQDLTCAFSPDRQLAATGVVGKSVRIWAVETGECLRQLVGHIERVWGLAWSRDGQRILSGSFDHTARLWDAKTGECLRVLEGHPGFVRALNFSADGRRAITAGGHDNDRSVRVWDLESGECVRILQGHTAGAYCALLASGGRRAVSGSRDGTIRVWDIESGHCERVIEAHRAHVQHLEWSDDEQRVLSCSLHLRLWDVETGRLLQGFEGHRDTVRTVEWSPDQRLIVSASHDRTVRVWDAASGHCVKVLEGHPTQVVSASWSRDQRRIVSCDVDAEIRIWE